MVARTFHAPRQIETRRVTRACFFLDTRATRITQSEQLRHLVEGLPCRVVERSSEQTVAPRSGHIDQQRMPPADHQADAFRNVIRTEKRRKQMTFDVVQREKRFVQRQGKSLGRRRADQKRAGQTRAGRRAEDVDVGQPHARLAQRLGHHAAKMRQVLP